MHVAPLKLKQDVVTRFNSTYDSLQRLLKVKEVLIATPAIMRPDIRLFHEDWQTIEKATDLLKPFYEITLEISGETHVSASKYIVFSKIITRVLNKYAPENNQKIQQLHNSLKVRCNKDLEK